MGLIAGLVIEHWKVAIGVFLLIPIVSVVATDSLFWSRFNLSARARKRLILGLLLVILSAPLALYFYARPWSESAATDAWCLLAGLLLVLSGPILALLIWGAAAPMAGIAILAEVYDEGAKGAVNTWLILIPWILFVIGPTFIWFSLNPVRQALGSDRVYCCAQGTQWSQSPDLRWLILADGGKAVKVTILDLTRGRIVRWRTPGGSSRMYAKGYYTGPTYYGPNDITVSPDAPPGVQGATIVVPALTQGAGVAGTSYIRVPVPASIEAQFARSWESDEELVVRNSAIERDTYLRTQWTSGDGDVTMTMKELELHSSIADDLLLGMISDYHMSERRAVVFRSKNNQEVLRTVRLTYLPTVINSDSSDWFEQSRPKFMVATNYVGSWWVIGDKGYLKLIHVPVR